MPIIDAMLAEFARECESTRKCLARIPEANFDWKPHPKSMSLGELSAHLCEIPVWAVDTVTKTELNFEPDSYKPWAPGSRQEVLDKFDENVKAAAAAMEGRTDEEMMVPWSLKASGKALFTMPRARCIRGMVLNHSIHHRAQLGVYLRLLDIPVPAIYGPSADENPFRAIENWELRITNSGK